MAKRTATTTTRLLAAALVAAACSGTHAPDVTPVGTAPASVAAGSGSGSGSAVGAAPPPTSRALVPVPSAVAANVKLTVVARDLARPVLVAAAPGDPARRLFVLEQHKARIRIIENGTVRKDPVLDLGGRVSTGNEQGLLGLALHPRFLDNGRMFIDYTATDDATHIVEYRFDIKTGRIDPASARPVWSLAQPYSNHNGGHLAFGPDGKLYVGMGDGGSAGDPHEAGQDPNNLLAKMLRFDVDAAATGVVTPEVVHRGVRNPWRFDFDPRDGALYIGDVGQDQWENIYVVAGDDHGAHNFGWSVTEGRHCFGATTCDQAAFTAPAIDYPHTDGCSVIGGVVYRGTALPSLAGAYFYADYCTGMLRSFRWAPGGDLRSGGVVTDHWDWKAALDAAGEVAEVASFGRDADGELYVVSLRGTIWKLTAS